MGVNDTYPHLLNINIMLESNVEGILLNGLLWDIKDLEFDGKHHFEFQEAQDIARMYGKRIPSIIELRELNNNERGRNFRNKTFKRRGFIWKNFASFGENYVGNYWCFTTILAVGSTKPKRHKIGTYDIDDNTFDDSCLDYLYPVRLVRDVKK